MKPKLKDIFFQVPLDISLANLIARAILLLILFLWAWKLIARDGVMREKKVGLNLIVAPRG